MKTKDEDFSGSQGGRWDNKRQECRTNQTPIGGFGELKQRICSAKMKISPGGSGGGGRWDNKREECRTMPHSLTLPLQHPHHTMGPTLASPTPHCQKKMVKNLICLTENGETKGQISSMEPCLTLSPPHCSTHTTP